MKLRIFLLIIILIASATQAEEISVTVYNSNLGVVSEVRTLEFEKGSGRLAITDVPSQIDVTSVQFELLSKPERVAILEQNYAYDLVSPDKIYRKYLDREIELIDKEGQIYTGTLLAFSGGAATLADKNGGIKIVAMSNITHANFPVLPEGMITKPTLFWLYNSSVSGQHDGRVSYQTGGMNWKAEYVGVLNEDDIELSLSGWASITNNSGKSYDQAALRLIAGDINRIEQNGRGQKLYRTMSAAVDMEATPGFQEKAFFEYHMYTLPRKTTLADKEIKQISLFDPARTNVEKIYRYHSNPGSKTVSVAVKFKNEAAAGLGMPLPAGRVRMFKADDDGTMVLLGEDMISHTPKDEEMIIKIGTAFDIIGEEKQTSRSIVSKKVEDTSYEIELRNHKSEAVTIEVTKSLYGFWEVAYCSVEYEKKNANTLIFTPTVEADSDMTIKLTIRHTHQ